MPLNPRRVALSVALLLASGTLAATATAYALVAPQGQATSEITELPWRINNGESLDAGHSLTSQSRAFHLTMQRDGNLVISRLMGGTPLWSSATDGSGGTTVRMQSDGNLVMYNASGDAVWATNTETDESEGSHTFARLDSDGALRLERRGVIVWSTPADSTAPKPPGNRPVPTSSNTPIPIPTRP